MNNTINSFPGSNHALMSYHRYFSSNWLQCTRKACNYTYNIKDATTYYLSAGICNRGNLNTLNKTHIHYLKRFDKKNVCTILTRNTILNLMLYLNKYTHTNSKYFKSGPMSVLMVVAYNNKVKKKNGFM